MIFVKVVINNQKAEVVEKVSSFFPQMPDRTFAGIGFFPYYDRGGGTGGGGGGGGPGGPWPPKNLSGWAKVYFGPPKIQTTGPPKVGGQWLKSLPNCF